MAAFCPSCRGLMRPQAGRMVCIRCSARARGQAQESLQAASASGPRAAFDPPLQPAAASWRPSARGAPHPQLGLFPHDSIRDGQRRLTRDVALAVQGGRLLVAQAPTGLGKTAATLAPAIGHAMATGKTVLFLTSRQSQHRIAVDTVRLIRERRGVDVALVDLVAKRDMCLRPEAREMHPARFPDFCSSETRNKTCSFLREVDPDAVQAVRSGVLHVEELMHVGRQAHLCPHLLALEAARRAHVVVADYNHVFSDIREQSLQRLGLRLEDCILVVDEAHNLPDRIRASHSHRIGSFLLSQVAQESRAARMKEVELDVDALDAAIRHLAAVAKEAGQSRSRLAGQAETVTIGPADFPAEFARQRNRGRLGTHRTLVDCVASLGELAASVRKGTDAAVHAEQLGEALEDWGRFGEGALRFVEHDGAGATLHVRLLDPGIPARLVFERVHAAVLASGTLRPPEMARDLLGLPAGRTTVRSYPSPFPPEHRLVVVAQGISSRFADRSPGLWRRVGGILADCAAAARGNVAVFAPSYAILREVRGALAEAGLEKETIVEEPEWTKADRDAVLDTLAGARDRRGGAVLLGVMGGSLAEGVDYRDNLLSVVAVVGLPLAPPDLEVEAACQYLDARFPGKGRAYGYTYPAMNKVLQAMGRPIRGATDKCVVLLLDERFLGPPYRGLLPEGLPVVATPDPAQPAKAFLQANGL